MFRYSSEGDDYYCVHDEDLNTLSAIEILATTYMNSHDDSVTDVSYSFSPFILAVCYVLHHDVNH